MGYKYSVGLESVKRVKLLMGYSLLKTLTENEESFLTEQSKNINPISDLIKKDYQLKHPDEVWDPNVTQKQQYLDKQGNTITKNIKVGGFVPLTPENMGLRGVPFGFHPEEYPEYLKKVAEIKKKVYNSTNWFEDNTDNTRNQELAKLKSQYYHADFPSGIKRQDYLDWVNGKKQLSAQQRIEFDNSRKLFSGDYRSPKDMPNSDYFLNVQNQNVKNAELYRQSQIRTDYKSMGDYMDAIYEYDPYSVKEINKSALEKWWDTYGNIAEFIGWVIIDAFSEGWLIPATEARQSYVLAKILKIAFRSGLPVAVGVARSFKAGHITENAVMDFVFAILPWAHSYFSISKTPSVQLVESIVSKRKGLNLREVGDVKKYIKILSEEEKYFFRKVAKLSQSELESALNKSLKDIDKIGKQVLKTTGKKIKPSMMKKVGTVLGRMAFIDLPAIQIANTLAKKFGFLDEEDKIKKLEEEFKSKQGTDLLILVANATETIKKYPNLSGDETIKKINQKSFAKTRDAAIKILTDENLLNSLLIDENGKPL